MPCVNELLLNYAINVENMSLNNTNMDNTCYAGLNSVERQIIIWFGNFHEMAEIVLVSLHQVLMWDRLSVLWFISDWSVCDTFYSAHGSYFLTLTRIWPLNRWVNCINSKMCLIYLTLLSLIDPTVNTYIFKHVEIMHV